MEVEYIFKIAAVGILVSIFPDTEAQRKGRAGISCKPCRASDCAVLDRAFISMIFFESIQSLFVM